MVSQQFLAVFLVLGLFAATGTRAAEFGHPGGPLPDDLDAVYEQTRSHSYDLELMLSFGTSSMGSAGHLAIAVKDAAPDGDDLVYSANFYADRSPKHATGFYTENLMAVVPKKEYLYGTSSSLGPDASFGLDYGEVYKRSVLGIRLGGVDRQVIRGLQNFFAQLNEDYRNDQSDTDYHSGLVTYDYMGLNCAKTVALAFKHGAEWDDVRIKGSSFFGRINPLKPLKANIPMETAIDIVEGASRRGWTMDVVLYKKYASTFVDPHAPDSPPYEKLPNRFPSTLSLDYRSGQGNYEDFDNLRAMNLMFHLGRYSLQINHDTRALEIERSKEPLGYAEAEEKARAAAKKNSKNLLRRVLFRTWGFRLGGEVDNSHLYNYDTPKNLEP